MRKNVPIFSRIALLLLVTFTRVSSQTHTQEPYKYKPADYQQFKNLSRADVAVLPQQYLREYDPLTIFFKIDAHPQGSGPEDAAEKVVQLTPSHPGEYRWLDARTLEFRPTIPWPPMQRFSVKVGRATHKLVTLLSPPERLVPANGATDLGAVEKIGLEFKYDVDPTVLSRLVTFEACPLPGIGKVGCKTFTSADYRIKVSEQTGSSGNYTYWFVMNQPFELGQKVRTHVRSTDDTSIAGARQSYFFDTKQEFALAKAGTHQHQFTINESGSFYDEEQALRLFEDEALVFDFTAAPAEPSLSQVKSLVNFSPAPRSFDFRLTNRRLSVNVSVDVDRMYQVTLEPTSIRDREGRALIMNGPSRFYFYKPRDRNFARWDKSYGIVERYGPQHFPLNISGIDNLDLRIYRIDPLSKAFWPFPQAPISVLEGKRPPGPGEEPTPEEQILYPLNPAQIVSHIQMLGSPHYSAIIDLNKEGVLRHGSLDLKTKLAEISGPEKSGTYLIGIRRLDGPPEREYVKIQVTDVCLSTVESKAEVLFTVTSYKSGQPVPNATIKIQGIQRNRFETLFSGVTDAQGMLPLKHDNRVMKRWRSFRVRRVIVQKGDDFLVMDTSTRFAPPRFANNHWYGQHGGWLQWLANQPYDFSKERTVKAHVFTERPLYRPEERVYLKGYLRDRFQGVISYTKKDSFFLRVQSPSDAEWTFPIHLTPEGSFTQDLPTGVYYVDVLDRTFQKNLANTRFSMEAYRLPRFEVKLHSPDRVPNDRPFQVDLTATYYAGGKVVSQPVKWRVTSFPYSSQPKGLEGYYLSSDSRFGSGEFAAGGSPQEIEQTTDENGQTRLTVNPQLELHGNPRRYVCEATVTGADQQTVSNSRSVIALPPFILGLKTQRYVQSGKSVAAHILALDVNEKFLAGQEVTILLKKMSWNSYLQETDFALGKPKYVTTESIDLMEEKKLITASEPVSVKFDNLQPGVYILEVDSRDRLGRLQTVKVDLFLAGDKPLVWQKPKQMVFETVADKTKYKPGETARILLKSPYQNGLALAVIETPDGRPEYQWLQVANGQATFEVPILPDMVPRMPVSFLLMRPRIAPPKTLPEGQKIDLGKPQTVANTSWLEVEPVSHRVHVAVRHDDVVLPGSQMTTDIFLTDASGQPLSGEVTLWLIDEAVLALMKEKNLDPLENFIDPVKSHISIRDTRNLALGDLRFRESPGGDEQEDREGLGALGKITVRRRFETVPYYNPRVMVDASGKTSVTLDMPDNLTNFAIRAVAISGPDKFGFAKSKVAVRLPVIIQPALPRFVRIGDTFKAGGIARVVEGTGGAGVFSMKVDGGNILSESGSHAETEGAITLPDQGVLPIFVDLEVPAPGYDEHGEFRVDSLTLQMAVQRNSDGAGDAFEVKIPLLNDRPPIVTEVFAKLSADSVFSWQALAETPRANTLNRKWFISDQLAILKVLAGLSFLMNYPHGCTEQKVSYAYPSLSYDEIWQQMGLESPDPRLKEFINQTLEFLQSAQIPDGLFGYWPGSKGYVYLTAYITEFLLAVQKANQTAGTGYRLDETMLTRALGALRRAVRSDYPQFLSGYKYYERCAALYALALAGRAETTYLRELAVQTTQVDLISQARILKAIHTSQVNLGDLTDGLENRLWNETLFRLQRGQEVFAGLQQRSMRIGAEVHATEITNLAGLVSAFAVTDRNPEKLQMMVDELVTLGSAGGWGQTNVNSQALLALRDFIAEARKSEVTAEFGLSTGAGLRTLNYDGRKAVLQYASKDAGAGRLRLQENPGNRQFYVRFSQSYLPQAFGHAAAARQRGFVVKRELIRVSQTEAPDSKVAIEQPNTTQTFAIADVLEEHIQVVNPTDRHFVAVSAPFAAGFEPLNPNLATASSEANPNGQTTERVDYQAFLDDRVVYYFDFLPSGTYDFYFRLRATTAGVFTHPPAEAEMMYEQKVTGSSPGVKIIVGRAK